MTQTAAHAIYLNRNVIVHGATGPKAVTVTPLEDPHGVLPTGKIRVRVVATGQELSVTRWRLR